MLEISNRTLITAVQCEYPFLCPGKAVIQIEGLSTAATYRITAELLDFSWNTQYVGSTELFTVSESAATNVALQMQRYNGEGSGNVSVDVIFNDEPQCLPPQAPLYDQNGTTLEQYAPNLDDCGGALPPVDNVGSGPRAI